ncbi:MAG: DUF883 C-terminal domain-containing protein [Pyrinomonadaceae bacterium]
MSQNKNDDPMNTTGANRGSQAGTGGASTGATDAGTTRDTSRSASTTGTTGGSGMSGGGTGMTRSTTATTPGGGGSGAAAGQGMAAQAQQYGQKIADAATTAKDYMSDKLSTAGDKLKDLQNVDVKQVTEDAKQYARQNPGQALLISAAAGFLLGLVLRGSRR